MESTLPKVAIDANIFLDLDELCPGDEESLPLRADWLSEFIELCLTEEIYNEVDRNSSSEKRQYQKVRVDRFRVLERRREREAEVRRELGGLFPTPLRPNDESDLQQLTLSICGDAVVFVTRDAEILGAAEQVYDRFELEIMAPHEVVRHCDSLRRADAYRPRRLFLGPKVTTSLVSAVQDLAPLIRTVQSAGEGARRTEARLRQMLADPTSVEVRAVKKGDSPLVCYALDRSRNGVLAVPFFVSSAETIGRTAARHFLDELISMSATEKRPVLLVTHPVSPVEEVLANHGFVAVGDVWVRFVLGGILNREEAAAQLLSAGRGCEEVAEVAEHLAQKLLADGCGDCKGLSERAFWPLKYSASRLRNFVVPIQPRWAKELFDSELARGTLFGAQPELALAVENVYYRAARPQLPTSEARVLWYVSGDSQYPGSMAIRACSYVDEVTVGSVKELFRKFRRLGVYSWRDVVGVTKGDPHGDVMAFRFSGTERFKKPVGFKSAQQLLEKYSGRGSQFQSPTEVPCSAFEAIYRAGMCLNED
jgi:predicted nucleic acid-binding protein